MNAFDHIVKATTETAARHAAAPAIASTGRLGRLLAIIARDPGVSSGDLAAALGGHSRLVWGLLKGPLARGQVLHVEGGWRLNDSYVPIQVQRAAELLRDAGWTVTPPSTSRGELHDAHCAHGITKGWCAHCELPKLVAGPRGETP